MMYARGKHKDGFPQSCEQGDNICQIKWYNDVCSRKTYTIKHWLKGAPVNKKMTFVNSNGIMMYARGKHTQLNIG